jgi:O-antigen/teichoic acid export membrane protein
MVDYAGTALNIAISLAVTPALIALLGTSLYGFWITASQMLLFLNLLDGGIGVYLIKTIGAHKNADLKSVQDAIASTFWCYVLLAAVTLIAGLLIAPHVGSWTHLAPGDTKAGIVAFTISIVTAALTLIAVPTFYVVLQGYQRLALVNGIVNAVAIAGIVTGFGLVYAGAGIAGMAVGQLIGACLGAMVAFAAARRVFAFQLARSNVKSERIRDIVRFAGYFSMSKLAFVASKFSDGILIAVFFGTAPVTVYVLTQKLASAASGVIGKVGGVSMPGLAELYGSRDTEALRRTTLRMTGLLTRVGTLATAMIIATNHRFVEAWTGAATFGGTALTLLFAYGVFRDGLIRNLATILFAAGDVRMWGYLSLLEAGVKVGLTIAFLPAFGIVAAIAATAMAEVITSVYVPLRVSRLIDMQPMRLLTEGVVPSLIRSVSTVVVLTAVANLVPWGWKWYGLFAIGAAGIMTNVLAFDWSYVRLSLARVVASLQGRAS